MGGTFSLVISRDEKGDPGKDGWAGLSTEPTNGERRGVEVVTGGPPVVTTEPDVIRTLQDLVVKVQTKVNTGTSEGGRGVTVLPPHHHPPARLFLVPLLSRSTINDPVLWEDGVVNPP